MEKPFAAYEGDESYIFVCYSHEDSDVVYPEIAWLHKQGTNLWYDEGISAGKNWRAAIGDSLLGASRVLFYISERSLKSNHCNREINLALDEDKDVVPVYLEEVELTSDLKVGLNRVQALHRDQNTNYRQHLLNALGRSARPPVKSAISDQVDLTAMHSIAILPFTNMSTNDEMGFLADGLSEDILDNLAQIERIKVASRSASFQFREPGQDPTVVGEKLNVAYLLEGSVRQRGDNLRITAQLIRSQDGFHVWSKSYERTLEDGFEMQTAVATNIAYIAEGKLSFDVFKSIGWKQNKRLAGIDPFAVRHYINADGEIRNIRLGEGGDLETWLQLLKNAVEVDSNFYLANATLANAYYQLHYGGRLSLEEARTGAHAAINSAKTVAPDDLSVLYWGSDTHLYFDLNYALAEAGYRQYLKRVPGHLFSHLRLARIALREGRTGDALRLMANVLEYDGSDRSGFLVLCAWIRSVGGDYEGALKLSAQGLKLAQGEGTEKSERTGGLKSHAANLIRLGRVEEAKPFIEEGWNLDGRTSPESYIVLFVNIGEIEKAREILTDSHFDHVDHFELAMGYLALGDSDNTFESIRAGIENQNAWLFESLLVAEWWNPIRDDPRFADMLDLLDSKVTHTQTYLNNLDPTGR